ncbi:hypothetical protein, partial [Paraburkholderia sp.]|uniref:hypothetical protein n=1 Tax=Paraburkholderia sp. TaxID=1926495 RepID=UPI0025F89B93
RNARKSRRRVATRQVTGTAAAAITDSRTDAPPSSGFFTRGPRFRALALTPNRLFDRSRCTGRVIAFCWPPFVLLLRFARQQAVAVDLVSFGCQIILAFHAA